MIGAVVLYEFLGVTGACGQQVGADGAGTYAVVFKADSPEEAEEAARAYCKKLTRIKDIRLVTAEHISVRGVTK